MAQTELTDIRWARLTRWRAAMAHFFDMPAICQASPSFRELQVSGRDTAQCALFAGWLEASLGWKGRVAYRCDPGESTDPMQNVTLSGPEGELHLQMLPHTTCLDTQARLGGAVIASRVVSLGDQGPRALLAEELRVRSRDLAFEQALERALERSAQHHP